MVTKCAIFISTMCFQIAEVIPFIVHKRQNIDHFLG